MRTDLRAITVGIPESTLPLAEILMTRFPTRQALAAVPAFATLQARKSAWRHGMLLLAFALQGCGSLPPAKEVSAVQLCVQQQCADASGQSDGPRLLEGLHRLLQRNDGQALQLCEADPQTRECTGDDLGYFVLGGVLPGRGSSSTATLRQVRMDAAQQTLHYRTSMSMRFLGIGLRCDEHDATLRVASPGRISITDSDHACNWMVVGIMKASFGFEVDSIDLDRGRLGGWWRHRVVGTGNGRGEGYAVIRFPTPLPPDEAQSVLKAAVAGR